MIVLILLMCNNESNSIINVYVIMCININY